MEMENQILAFLKQLNEKVEKMNDKIEKMDDKIEKLEKKMDDKFEKMNQRIDKLESRVGNIETRLDRHEQLLQQLINMTAKNTEDITALRMEMNQRFEKLELTDYKMSTDINLLFQETQTNKRDIAQLKNQ